MLQNFGSCILNIALVTKRNYFLIVFIMQLFSNFTKHLTVSKEF